MRALPLVAAALLLGVAPLRAQMGTIEVSLTVLEPVSAAVQPEVALAPAPGGVQVTAQVKLRGAAAWVVSNGSTFATPPADHASLADPAACDPWAGSAAPGGEPMRRNLTVSARCAVAGRGARSASAPLVITLATN